jgi:hypothetical protein
MPGKSYFHAQRHQKAHCKTLKQDKIQLIKDKNPSMTQSLRQVSSCAPSNMHLAEIEVRLALMFTQAKLRQSTGDSPAKRPELH